VRFVTFHAIIKISTTQNERNSHRPAKVPMHGNIAAKQLYILHICVASNNVLKCNVL